MENGTEVLIKVWINIFNRLLTQLELVKSYIKFYFHFQKALTTHPLKFLFK